jgi:hypothetical protein
MIINQFDNQKISICFITHHFEGFFSDFSNGMLETYVTQGAVVVLLLVLLSEG